MSRTVARPFAAVLALALSLLLPLSAAAHPLGNFSINHYARLEVGPNRLDVVYVTDTAEVPTFQLKARIDVNGDGRLDAAEQTAYLTTRVTELMAGLGLTVDGRAVSLTAASPRLELLPGQGGLETLRLTFRASAAIPAEARPLRVAFEDRNDLDRVGWREIVLRSKDGARLTEATAPETDVSNELRSYPDALLNNPIRMTGATFTLSASGGAGEVSGPVGQGQSAGLKTGNDTLFASLINQGDLAPGAVAVALLTALALGALHALEPGHGKGVAAAYLVGTRATPYHAILLGSTVTVTHTASVFVMGVVTLFLSAFIVPEQLFPFLSLASAAIVLAMGTRMVVQAVREQRMNVVTDHSHELDDQAMSLTHTHGGKAHTHVPTGKLSVRNVLAVGVSGGLVPCPAALIVLLSAIALGRVGFGMLLILVFSLGLAGVLTAISLLVVYSKRMLGRSVWARNFVSRLNRSGRVAKALPILSGVIVIGAGLLLLYYAVPFLRILQ